MQKIAELVALPADATEAQIVKALKERFGTAEGYQTALLNVGKLLELHAEASPKEVLAELNKRFKAHASSVTSIEQLQADLLAAKNELDQMRTIPKRDTPAVNAVGLSDKKRVGLTGEQALAVMAAQEAHDATNPHDKPPKTAA